MGGGVEHSGNFYPTDAEFFSEGMLLLKAGSVSEVLSDLHAAEAFEAYLGLYAEVLREAPPAEEPLELEVAQARYCQWNASTIRRARSSLPSSGRSGRGDTRNFS